MKTKRILCVLMNICSLSHLVVVAPFERLSYILSISHREFRASHCLVTNERICLLLSLVFRFRPSTTSASGRWSVARNFSLSGLRDIASSEARQVVHMAIDIRNSWGSSNTATIVEGIHQPFVATVRCLEDNVFEEHGDGEVLVAYMPGFGFGMDSGKPYLAPLNVFKAGAETPWSEWVQGGLLILFRTVVAGQIIVHLLTAKVGDRFQDGVGWNISAGTLSPLEVVMVNAAQHVVRTTLGSKRHPKGAADAADAKALAAHLSNGVWPVQFRSGLKGQAGQRGARQGVGAGLGREAVAAAFEVEDLDVQV